MASQNSFIQLAYQVCPIIFTGGIADQVPGGMLPFLSVIGVNNRLDLNIGANITDLDDAFGAFNVLPGGTLVAQTVAKYPFANQFVASNATIREPITVSVIMDAPMRGPNAWLRKQTVMTALKMTLDRHNNLGGTYTVMTPAYMYDNMLMTSLTDNSRGQGSLPQNAWRFDFERPLVAITDLQGAQNMLMNKISGGLPTDATQTGTQVGSTTGQSILALPNDTTSTFMGQITSNSNSLNPLVTTPMTQNFPAYMNMSGFAFNGIS